MPERPEQPIQLEPPGSPAPGSPARGSPAPVRRLRVTVLMIGLAGCSSLLGLVRDQCIARFFGTSAQTDAFLVAWSVPETVTPLLMDGAVVLLLVPVFARALAGGGSIQPAVRATFASYCLALLALTGLVAAAAPTLVRLFVPGLADPALAVRCLRVAASTVLTLGIAGYLTAALRTSGRYLVTMTVYSAFNVGVLAMMLGLHRSAGVYAVAIGLAVGGGLTVAVQLGPFLRRTSLRHLRLLPPRAVGLAVAGILPVATYTIGRHAQIYVERYYGSGLRPGSISALNYAERIGQIPMQAATMLAVVSFPVLAKHAAAGRSDELRRGVERDLRMAAYLIAPAVSLFVALAPAVVALLFQRGAFGANEVTATATALRAYSLGLLGQTIVVVGAVCLSSLAPTSWSLARAAGAGLALTVLVDAALVGPMGIAGLALGNAAGITLTAIVGILALRRRLAGFDAAGLVGCTVRCVVAATVAVAAGGLTSRLPVPAGATVAIGALGVAVGYLATARLLGLDEARQTCSLVRAGAAAAVAAVRRVVAAPSGQPAPATDGDCGGRSDSQTGGHADSAVRSPAGGPAGSRAGSPADSRTGGRAGRLTFLGSAVVAGGCLGLMIGVATPTRFTAVELLLVVPPPGQQQSAVQTRYAAGVQRVLTELTDARADHRVRMMVTPDAPLIEIDATGASSEAAVARAAAAAAAVEAAWRDRSGGAGPRLVRALPAGVIARRTAPIVPVDGLVGAILGAAAATVVGAIRGRWPALPRPGGRFGRVPRDRPPAGPDPEPPGNHPKWTAEGRLVG